MDKETKKNQQHLASLQPEEKALLALLRRALMGERQEDSECLKAADWDAVFSEASRQTVLPLVVEAASELPKWIKPDQNKLSPFGHAAIFQVANHERLLAAQDNLLAQFKAQSIPCVILKGASAAFQYPRPELRVMGDIDVLVNRSDLDRAADALRRFGFIEQVEDHAQHITFFKDSICVELHYCVSTYPKNRAGEVIENLMRSWLSDAIPRTMGQHEFHALSNAHQAVSLLLHMQYHITGSGLGLRQVCDWAVFVQHIDEGEWLQDIQPVLKRCGLLRFSQIITATCFRYLGLPQGKCTWYADVPSALCLDLMLDFFASGNFGRKDPSRLTSSFLLSDRDPQSAGRISLTEAVRKLNQNAYLHYPQIKKLPALLPLMWVWLPVRYLFRNRKSKNVSEIMKGSLSGARKRSSLYSQFRLFEVDKKDE